MTLKINCWIALWGRKSDNLIIVLGSVRFRSIVRLEILWLILPTQWECSATTKKTDQFLTAADCIVEYQVRCQPQHSKTMTLNTPLDASKSLQIKTISHRMDPNSKWTCKYSFLLTSKTSRTNLPLTC